MNIFEMKVKFNAFLQLYRKRSGILNLILVCLAMNLGSPISSAALPSSSSESTVPSLKGSVLSGLDLLQDRQVTFSADGKKALVVVFLSALCPCSNSHVDELKSLAKIYGSIAFVGVHSNANEKLETAKSYFSSAKLPFSVIQDSRHDLADQLKAVRTPHAFVLNSEGQILYKGGVSDSSDCSKAGRKYLREALADIDSGKPVRTPEGRALGCAISRGESPW
jgi:hypothetical protein